ncbi:MAG: putative membrane-anchored protein [Flavobacterium sp.]
MFKINLIMEKINKIATLTLGFWLLKIVATTFGETFGDYLSMTLGIGYLQSLAITSTFFLAVLSFQLQCKKFNSILFWLVIIGTTTLGTEISDFLDRSLHLGYALGSIILFICLQLTLLFWYLNYKSLKVYPIFEKKKEIYFWIAILFSNCLGTAFGDFLTDNLQWSYLLASILTASVILIVIVLHYRTKKNKAVLFWIAFIFTRPFGATFGDFITKPTTKGGLDLGTLQASLFCMVLMAILLFLFERRDKMKKLD